MMNPSSATGYAENLLSMVEDYRDYLIDSLQRSILFGDIIRKRGNAYLDHLKLGQPPVLVFDYDVISDGRERERPVNYQLVRIIDRRKSTRKAPEAATDRRAEQSHSQETGPHPRKRPIVVIDPRAGHGPGIGGSKLDSQIGVALNAGHPVYFIMFFTEPVPGQTIADVQQCQIHFLEEIARLHPDAPKPAVIGNCQAGWAAALVGADRPDVTGPLVLNGSPLSYWGGVKGANPMRYRGGLYGGSWLASLCSDLGNGRFDGANLVAGFESLNPANTYWKKLYNVYAGVDTEEKRFLDFEKWWGGFFLLSREEIRFIVSHLFVTNELEQGFLKLQEGRFINLKNFKDPIVVFASRGDNITPPQQALNWITKVYSSVDEIKRHGQVIVYLLHDKIGHLGIFVSSKINRKEHTNIIGCVDYIEFLAPGLYEMIIKEGPSKPWLNDHEVDFVERDMSDILAMDDGFEDEEAFHAVSSVSRFNETLYQTVVSPFVRMTASEVTAEWFRQTHPLRVQRYGLSDMNPFMWPFKAAAETVRKDRRPAGHDNLFKRMEEAASDWVVDMLDLYRETRDNFFETLFYTFYGNQWSKALFSPAERETPAGARDDHCEKSDIFREMQEDLWLRAMRTGGFEEAVVRIILAVTMANRTFSMKEYEAARLTMKGDDRLKAIEPGRLRNMIKNQAALLEKDRKMALSTLVDLVPDQKDRTLALEAANTIVQADDETGAGEIALLDEIETILFSREA